VCRDPWDRPRWPRGHRRSAPSPAPARCPRCSPCLAVHVGPQGEEKALDVVVLEHDNVVYGALTRHEERPLRRFDERPAGALEPAHRLVAVDPHHEHVTLGLGALEITNVADVEDVEAAVGERHGAPFAMGLLHGAGHVLDRGHFRRRRAHGAHLTPAPRGRPSSRQRIPWRCHASSPRSRRPHSRAWPPRPAGRPLQERG
jgi:hypothetical protein